MKNYEKLLRDLNNMLLFIFIVGLILSVVSLFTTAHLFFFVEEITVTIKVLRGISVLFNLLFLVFVALVMAFKV